MQEFTLFLGSRGGTALSHKVQSYYLKGTAEQQSMLKPFQIILSIAKVCSPSRSFLRSLGITNPATKGFLYNAYAREEKSI